MKTNNQNQEQSVPAGLERALEFIRAIEEGREPKTDVEWRAEKLDYKNANSKKLVSDYFSACDGLRTLRQEVWEWFPKVLPFKDDPGFRERLSQTAWNAFQVTSGFLAVQLATHREINRRLDAWTRSERLGHNRLFGLWGAAVDRGDQEAEERYLEELFQIGLSITRNWRPHPEGDDAWKSIMYEALRELWNKKYRGMHPALILEYMVDGEFRIAYLRMRSRFIDEVRRLKRQADHEVPLEEWNTDSRLPPISEELDPDVYRDLKALENRHVDKSPPKNVGAFSILARHMASGEMSEKEVCAEIATELKVGPRQARNLYIKARDKMSRLSRIREGLIAAQRTGERAAIPMAKPKAKAPSLDIYDKNAS